MLIAQAQVPTQCKASSGVIPSKYASLRHHNPILTKIQHWEVCAVPNDDPGSILRSKDYLWHPGNVYTAQEAPATPTFVRSVSDCSDALKYSNLNAVSNFRVSLFCDGGYPATI
jgi:hypothetical protein